jgi:hypothetical protein
LSAVGGGGVPVQAGGAAERALGPLLPSSPLVWPRRPLTLAPLLTLPTPPPPSQISHHHKYPMDTDRLVFPPVPAALVVALFWGLLNALAPAVSARAPGRRWAFLLRMPFPSRRAGPPLLRQAAAPHPECRSPTPHPTTNLQGYAAALLGGGILGYVVYDTTHWALHSGAWDPFVTAALRTQHHAHHYVDDKVWRGGWGGGGQRRGAWCGGIARPTTEFEVPARRRVVIPSRALALAASQPSRPCLPPPPRPQRLATASPP